MSTLSSIGLSFVGFMISGALSKHKSSSTYTYCYNYTECENETISTTYASCYGYYGCDGSDISSTYTLAYGELGCYSSEIDSEYTYGYGHYGTYGAAISTLDLYGYGYECSRVADIEPYDTELNIYFYGYYSGYGSDVSCYSGDTCYLYCGSGRGCYLVDFYCYSGATCYYDCSSDDVCPTSYSGVDSDLTYVTSDGTQSTSSSSSSSKYLNAESRAILFTGLTDEEINEYKQRNQLNKDKSKLRLEQDTLLDTQTQKKMTYDQEFWYSGQVAKEQADREAEREREEAEEGKEEEQYAIIKQFKNYKQHNGNGFNIITLDEFVVGFIIDISIIAVVTQVYKYCIKSKDYQSL